MAILNRSYIVFKHSLPGSAGRRRLKRFLLYKLARYVLQANSGYGRRRLIGAWCALSRVPRLAETPIKELPKRYVQLRQDCLRRLHI